MSFSQIAVIFAIFSGVWGGSVYVLDLRNDARINELEISLSETIKEELSKYKNVYTAQEIAELIRRGHQKDIQDIKTLIEDGNEKQNKELNASAKRAARQATNLRIENEIALFRQEKIAVFINNKTVIFKWRYNPKTDKWDLIED